MLGNVAVSAPNLSLVNCLADGAFHSGEALAATLGVSRTAVWKQLNRLQEDYGLAVESVKGRGYRIPGGLELLEAPRILEALSVRSRHLLGELLIEPVLDSTNAEALRRLAAGSPPGFCCSAELQTAGRGRRGRPWVSPFARNLYLSLTWEYEGGAAALEGLSLAVGVAVVRALESLGIRGMQLKWPNDLLFHGAKLGGILLEMVGDAAGPCQVVVGVGLNVHMPTGVAASIDQSWTDLRSLAGDQLPGRNHLLAAMLDQLLPLLAGFGASGFAPWREAWMSLDAYAGAPVVISSGDFRQAGTARGVDQRGALQLETSLGVQPVYGGEVSLRPAS